MIYKKRNGWKVTGHPEKFFYTFEEAEKFTGEEEICEEEICEECECDPCECEWKSVEEILSETESSNEEPF